MSEIDPLAKANALLISGIISELVRENIFSSQNVAGIHAFGVDHAPKDQPEIVEYLLENLENSLKVFDKKDSETN